MTDELKKAEMAAHAYDGLGACMSGVDRPQAAIRALSASQEAAAPSEVCKPDCYCALAGVSDEGCGTLPVAVQLVAGTVDDAIEEWMGIAKRGIEGFRQRSSLGMIASPAVAPVAVGVKDETAWLIELRGSRPTWWSLHPEEEPGWVPDANKALRFSRKEDAEAYINDTGWTDAFATEHMWPAHRPHDWFEFKGMKCCRSCGNVWNATSDTRSCKGQVKVELRSSIIPATKGGEDAMRKALEPFAGIAPYVEYADKRDGEVVHRQRVITDGKHVGYKELTKADFRAALAALSAQDTDGVAK